MPPGAWIVARAASVARSTAVWPAASPGWPRVRPNGYSMAAMRGTLTAAVRSGTGDRLMVVKPAASISRCTSPTDQQQIGQAGTSTTTSA